MQCRQPCPKQDTQHAQSYGGPQAVNEQNAARLPLMMATKLLPDMEAMEAHMLQAQRAAAQGQDLGTQIADLTVSGLRQAAAMHMGIWHVQGPCTRCSSIACVVAQAKLPAGPSTGLGPLQSACTASACCSLHVRAQAQSDHLNAVVRALTQADPGDAASAPLDPQGARYKRLVQDLKMGFAPAPTRQLPSQVRPLPCVLRLCSLPCCQRHRHLLHMFIAAGRP